MIAKITKAYIRYYGDTGQTKAYVEWVDQHGKTGRTEGDAVRWREIGLHMRALFRRAMHEGVEIERQSW